MAISLISDIHIKDEGDKAHQVFNKFVNHPLVIESERVIFLGDVFDLMSGNHWQYFKRYKLIFEKFNEILSRGQELFFFEGNHDIHIEKLFRTYFKTQGTNDSKFRVFKHEFIEERWGKKFYYAHGDEVEVGNESYLKYKKFITSTPLEFVSNHIMPYWVLTKIGEDQSKRSRERSGHYSEDSTRATYRDAVKKLANDGYDYIILGHTHVQEEFSAKSEKGRDFTYLNNGFAPKSNGFIYISEAESKFHSF